MSPSLTFIYQSIYIISHDIAPCMVHLQRFPTMSQSVTIISHSISVISHGIALCVVYLQGFPMAILKDCRLAESSWLAELRSRGGGGRLLSLMLGGAGTGCMVAPPAAICWRALTTLPASLPLPPLPRGLADLRSPPMRPSLSLFR